MKTLLLVRHAKSDWGNPALPDFERPLNERGKMAAPMMAKRLIERGVTIDAFISSPAKRAKKTAILFANEYHVEKEKVILGDDLYEAGVDDFYTAIINADDRFNTIAVFSHNPGITDFASLLTDTRIDEIPTCGIFAVSMENRSWKQFRDAEKKFLFFDFPKNG